MAIRKSKVLKAFRKGWRFYDQKKKNVSRANSVCVCLNYTTMNERRINRDCIRSTRYVFTIVDVENSAEKSSIFRITYFVEVIAFSFIRLLALSRNCPPPPCTHETGDENNVSPSYVPTAIIQPRPSRPFHFIEGTDVLYERSRERSLFEDASVA